MFIRILSFIVCLTILIIPLSANADGADISVPANNIVTEFYSNDLYEDIVSTAAIPVSTAPKTTAKAVILMEKNTGKILYNKNENEKLAPASITKIMTMLLVIEAIENKKLSFYDKVSTSEHASSMGGSQIWLEVGEKMTVHDLMKAVAVGSANDAAVSLAEKVAGSEEGFVALMNERAKELGMNNTTFVNACGLDNDNQLTSAKDVAIMSRELIKHDTIKQYTSIWMDSLRNDKVELVNTNKMVRFYSGATGLKTGTTSIAGCCLSATAKRNGMELIAVVMNAPSSKERFSDAKKLLDYGFANWTIYKPIIKTKIPKTVKVKNGKEKTVNINHEQIEYELLKIDEKDNIKTIVKLKEKIEAPFKIKKQVGSITIYNNNEKLREYKIYTEKPVDKSDYGFCLKTILLSLIKL